MSTLMTHRGSLRITRDELAQVPAPEPTETWKPVPHMELVNTLTDILTGRGFHVQKEEYAVQQKGNILFGVLDFTKGDVTKWALGFHT